MLLWIEEGDSIGRMIIIAKLLEELRALETTAAAAVNLAQSLERRDRDFVGRESYDCAVTLVRGQDGANLAICGAPPPYPYGRKVRARVTSRKFGEWGDKGGVENVAIEEEGKDESYRECGVDGHGDEKIESLRRGGFLPDFLCRTIGSTGLTSRQRPKDLPFILAIAISNDRG
jgi:hypothetical protein